MHRGASRSCTALTPALYTVRRLTCPSHALRTVAGTEPRVTGPFDNSAIAALAATAQAMAPHTPFEGRESSGAPVVGGAAGLEVGLGLAGLAGLEGA